MFKVDGVGHEYSALYGLTRSHVVVVVAGDNTVELAMTGTALPVLLDIAPASKFDFGEVPVGEHADILCTVKNSSEVLPVTYQFRRIAHFISHPPNGKIPPCGVQDVIFSFAPNQAG